MQSLRYAGTKKVLRIGGALMRFGIGRNQHNAERSCILLIRFLVSFALKGSDLP